MSSMQLRPVWRLIPALRSSAICCGRSLWVAEIVYLPLETDLLREAKAVGCRTLDGGGMAVFQAVESFRLFTEIDPDPGHMLRRFAQLVQPTAPVDLLAPA